MGEVFINKKTFGPSVAYSCGMACERNGMYKKAGYWYYKAAQSGHLQAANNLGLLVHHGKGHKKDDEKARELFLHAAEQGNQDAQNNLGMSYLLRAEDYVKSRYWFEKAIDNDSLPAYFNMGSLDLFEEKYADALKWFTVFKIKGGTEREGFNKEVFAGEIKRAKEHLAEEKIKNAERLACEFCYPAKK